MRLTILWPSGCLTAGASITWNKTPECIGSPHVPAFTSASTFRFCFSLYVEWWILWIASSDFILQINIEGGLALELCNLFLSIQQQLWNRFWLCMFWRQALWVCDAQVWLLILLCYWCICLYLEQNLGERRTCTWRLMGLLLSLWRRPLHDTMHHHRELSRVFLQLCDWAVEALSNLHWSWWPLVTLLSFLIRRLCGS